LVIAFYLHSKGRSLFIFTVRGDRFFLAEGREAIAFYLYREKGDRFLSVSRRGRSLFILIVSGDRCLYISVKGRSLFSY
jgi:hypothetical protein